MPPGVKAGETSGKDVFRSSTRLNNPKTSGCDILFSSHSSKNGTFTSPQYPNPYPPRSHCRYDFQGRGRERIEIRFSDFNLYHSSSDHKDCESLDTINAYVRIEGRLEKIDAFCGSSMPKSLMSNGPRLTLEFRGIFSSRKVRGFKAFYRFTENFGLSNGKQLTEYPCAFVFNSNDSRNGTFTSPNYPGFYPRDTECHFFFHGSQRERVNLHFTYFDIEGVLPCEAISASDYIEFSNYMARDRKYSRHCGQLKPFFVQSDREFFRVTFRSNDRLDGTGFQARYQFLDEIQAQGPKLISRNSSRRIVPNLVLMILLIQVVYPQNLKYYCPAFPPRRGYITVSRGETSYTMYAIAPGKTFEMIYPASEKDSWISTCVQQYIGPDLVMISDHCFTTYINLI